MEEMQDRPCISDKSRELAMSNLRYKKPLYSPERYPLEIENYWNKRDMAIKKKMMEDEEKEKSEDLEMSKFL